MLTKKVGDGIMKVRGLQTEFNENAKLNARTIAIIHALEQYGVVKAELNESDRDDLDTIKALRQVAEEVSYTLLHETETSVYYLIDDTKIESR